MKERPILFSGPMVRALIDGRKTQTRRIVKGDHSRVYWNQVMVGNYGGWVDEHGRPCRCPYGQPGDRLWVRETFRYGSDGLEYRADDDDPKLLKGWKSPYHMHRHESRIMLEITDVLVERLQDISEDDARAEGAAVEFEMDAADFITDKKIKNESFKLGYKHLWQSINGPGSWEANPWVWVLTFKRLEVKK